MLGGASAGLSPRLARPAPQGQLFLMTSSKTGLRVVVVMDSEAYQLLSEKKKERKKENRFVSPSLAPVQYLRT